MLPPRTQGPDGRLRHLLVRGVSGGTGDLVMQFDNERFDQERLDDGQFDAESSGDRRVHREPRRPTRRLSAFGVEADQREDSVWVDDPAAARIPDFRLACCMCRNPIPSHSDVYALDAEWQRRYPRMVGTLACQGCALGTHWSCRQRDGLTDDGLTDVEGHIPVPQVSGT